LPLQLVRSQSLNLFPWCCWLQSHRTLPKLLTVTLFFVNLRDSFNNCSIILDRPCMKALEVLEPGTQGSQREKPSYPVMSMT
jgi:hypothetical protein